MAGEDWTEGAAFVIDSSNAAGSPPGSGTLIRVSGGWLLHLRLALPVWSRVVADSPRVRPHLSPWEGRGFCFISPVRVVSPRRSVQAGIEASDSATLGLTFEG